MLRWRERYYWPPARPAITVSAGDLWPSRDRAAAGQARHRRGQDNRVEEYGAAGLPRRTNQADSLIAGAYLAGTNTRRVRRALSAVFGGVVSKDTVSRVWRKVKGDWDAWNARSLAEEPIVRLILDGTVVRVRLNRKATAIVLLVVFGVREDGQKVLLAVKNMGCETSEAWRVVLDDLVKRGLRRPEFLIVDGGSGLEQALAGLWGDVPTQRCTVHKHRNLLAHAPQRLHEQVSADYTDMIYAASSGEVEVRRRAFIRKWRLKCKAVAASLEEAGDRLFTFTRVSQHHQADSGAGGLERRDHRSCPSAYPRYRPRHPGGVEMEGNPRLVP
jgi:transposase-like protein